MKAYNISAVVKLMALSVIIFGCKQTPPHDHQEASQQASSHGEHVVLSLLQYQALGMSVDTLPKRAMEGFVETNGQLILPPQSQAAVTTVIGANIQSVDVIEGNWVEKGQILAKLYHPDLITLQTEYTSSVNQLDYLEQSYARQEKLYAQSVSAGKDFQKIKADYLSKKATVNGQLAQLKLLHINADKVKAGHIYETVALTAPIDGYIQSVNVRTGQFVAPSEVLFEIVRTDHIHAHFKVFESDINKVKEGQTVHFMVESQPETQREATIFAVGKVFESTSKAVNLHAELDNKMGTLLPGMYARGRIVTGSERTLVLPKDAVVMDGERHFIFQAEEHPQSGEWHFYPKEISTGLVDDNWVEVKPHHEIDSDMLFAWNNAYYLLAEMQKSETEHHH
ncbi:MAG: hemolysin D [Cyclobacteriaceae bacterium]|nr:MAG: hemolysin D [Cyclobacteriaceae bacterium]